MLNEPSTYRSFPEKAYLRTRISLFRIAWMEPTSEVNDRRIFIQNLIATAKMEAALKELIDLVSNVDEENRFVVIILSMEYYDLKRDYIARVIPREEFRIAKNNLAMRMLQLLDDLNTPSPLPTDEP